MQLTSHYKQSEIVLLQIVDNLPMDLWGIPLAQWQERAWIKAGTKRADEQVREHQSILLAGAEWILSPVIARALIDRPGTVLIADDLFHGQTRIAAIHCPVGADPETYKHLFDLPDPDWSHLQDIGLIPVQADDLAGSYDEALRKREPHYLMSVLTHTPADIEKRLFKGAYKGVTDLVTKYIWPWPALHVTRLAALLRITPNMITSLSLVLTILAFGLFWRGDWIPGLAAAWGMTFLDTVDGKLARTTMTYSAWGNIYDHGIDLIHPPFWYLAIYMGISTTGSVPPWLLSALMVIMAGYVLGRAIEGLFIWRTGFHIHVWKPIDSRMREITARRNPNMLIFTIAVIFGLPAIGFGLIAVWTIICLVFHSFRLFQAYLTPQPHKSWLEA